MSMILHTLKKLPKNTYEILVIIPKDEIAKEYEKAFMKLQDNLTVEGFRKGKAPREIAEKNLPRQDVYQQVIQDLLPEVYAEIVKKENITPVVSPKVDLVKAKEGEDWELKMEVAEKPSIDLSNYKEIVRKAKQDAKKPEIWTPGSAPKAENPEEKKQDNLNEVLSALLKDVKIEISELIIEQELNHRLTKLVDDIQKIGLTVDGYLKSKNMTMEDMRKQFSNEIEETYKLEFLLSEIADKENIQVADEDLQKLFTNLKSEEDKKQAQQNAYFYASIIRKQKTLDCVLGL